MSTAADVRIEAARLKLELDRRLNQVSDPYAVYLAEHQTSDERIAELGTVGLFLLF